MSTGNGKLLACAELVKDQLPTWILSKIRDGEMVSHSVRVDPELATQWLQCNTHNRPHKPKFIATLAEAIKDGKWKQTHQGIAFDPKNTLLDGQNRLWACIEAGKSILVQVTFNEPTENRKWIDGNQPRSPMDLLRLDGYNWVQSIHSAIIKALAGRSYDTQRMRADQLSFFADNYGEGIRFVMDATHGKKVKRVTGATVLACCVRAYYKRGVSRERLRQFLEILISGQSNGASDSAVILLRNRLIACVDANNRMTRDIIHRLTERAIQNFLSNQEMKSLRAVDKEIYSLPHEK
jgi:tellurite resistance protein